MCAGQQHKLQKCIKLGVEIVYEACYNRYCAKRRWDLPYKNDSGSNPALFLSSFTV